MIVTKIISYKYAWVTTDDSFTLDKSRYQPRLPAQQDEHHKRGGKKRDKLTKQIARAHTGHGCGDEQAGTYWWGK